MSRAGSSWRDSVRQRSGTSACRLVTLNTTRLPVRPALHIPAGPWDWDPDLDGVREELEEAAHLEHLLRNDFDNV